MTDRADPASFRDPSGFVYRDADGRLLRQINRAYEADYKPLVESGLWDALTAAGLLIPHTEVDLACRATDDAMAVIAPEPVPFVSHPYEWCFGQLRAAALLTLAIQKKALDRGFILKDASAYNVQFTGCQPVFIDTLSFERYEDGTPWVGYGQFCRHFLAPLALMQYVNPNLNRMLAVHLDGIPVEMAAAMLPRRTWMRLGLAVHLHLLGRAERRHAQYMDAMGPSKQARVSKHNLIALIDSLESTVRRMHPPAGKGLWTDYSGCDSYCDGGAEKRNWVADKLAAIRPKTVWDCGANTGEYSRIAADAGAYVVAMDGDTTCVDRMWQAGNDAKDRNVLPLTLDLANPSPALGWHHRERAALLQRGPADCVLALAIVHHLAITNNVPLDRLAQFFADAGRHAIIEFVPKDDPQTQRLLQSRRDIFDHYTRDAFEQAFGARFAIESKQDIADSKRTIYHLKKRT